MRRLWIAVLAAAAPLAAGARDLGRGTLELSGAAGIELGNSRTEAGATVVEESHRSVDGAALYYVLPNLGVGALVSYQRSHTDASAGGSSSSLTTSATSWGPAVGGNLDVSERVSLFANAALVRGTSSSTFSSPLGSTEQDLEGWGWRAGVGISLFAADTVAVRLGLAWAGLDSEDDAGQKVETRVLSVTAGVSVFLFGEPDGRAHP